MNLLPKILEEVLPPLYSQDKTDQREQRVYAKFFATGASWTWYALEGSRNPNSEMVFFGYVEGADSEYGYFTLREFEEINACSEWNFRIERDITIAPGTKLIDLVPNLRIFKDE